MLHSADVFDLYEYDDRYFKKIQSTKMGRLRTVVMTVVPLKMLVVGSR